MDEPDKHNNHEYAMCWHDMGQDEFISRAHKYYEELFTHKNYTIHNVRHTMNYPAQWRCYAVVTKDA